MSTYTGVCFTYCTVVWCLSSLGTLLSTDPDPVTGDMESAMAVQLNPWVEYEFRVVASNAIGTGDPSAPSRGVRTKEAGKSSKPLRLDKYSQPQVFFLCHILTNIITKSRNLLYNIFSANSSWWIFVARELLVTAAPSCHFMTMLCPHC